MTRHRVRILIPVVIGLLGGIAGLVLQEKGGNAANKTNWKLSGTEILLELHGTGGKAKSGIYALDESASQPKPVLLVEEGERPVWSPSRRYFAYMKEGYLWIAERTGRSVRIDELPVLHLEPHMPPIQWSWQDGVFLVAKYDSVGTVSCIVLGLEHLTGSSTTWHAFRTTPVLPLKHRVARGSGAKILSSDVLAARRLSMSPDDMHMAAEVSPLAPLDLLRNQAKILIYDQAANPDHMQDGLFLFMDFATGPGRRLTRLGSEVAELNPLWSPKGDWIAFTAVHLDDGYVAPAVCRPDGSEYTELLPAKVKNYTLTWPDSPKWLPVSPVDTHDNPDQGHYAISCAWGNPHVWPVEWSEDGRYLLLCKGARFTSLKLARYTEGKWEVGELGTVMSGGPLKYVPAGISFAALGPPSSGGRVAFVPEPGGSVLVLDKERSKRRQIDIPVGYTISWLDW